MTWSAFQRRMGSWWLSVWWHALRIKSKRRNRRCRPPVAFEGRQLFLDVSEIARHDAGTGIQRVVRSIALELIASPPSGWRVVPVAATRKRPYFRSEWPSTQGPLHDSALQPLPGDVFLGLDFALDTIYRHRRQLQTLSNRGVRMWFVMYDLLPVSRPDWFSDRLVIRYQRWLRTTSALADGFQCISPDVSDKLRAHLRDHFGLTPTHMPALEVFPMGWEFGHATSMQGVSAEFQHVVDAVAGKKGILMVGTLEPRKGYAEALDAFDLLSQKAPGVYGLVIVGRPGWKTEELQKRLRLHPELGRSVFWFDQATDAEVAHLYKTCAGVLMASHAEGFGLPLVEALGHGIPVLARDIPVFHTLSAANLEHFPAFATPQELADRMAIWLSRNREVPLCVKRPSLPTWRAAAQHLMMSFSENG